MDESNATDATPDTGANATSDVAAELPDASDAFARLGSETRLRILRALADAETPPTFTELFETTDEETTAGFAYHLRQLVGHYVEKRDETYHLTYAGRQVARALLAGTYTERIDREPESIDGTCPVCDDEALEATCADNRVTVACTECDTVLLTLPFPPSGARGRSTAELLDAFDSHHRSRVGLVADGVCPDCAGRAVGRIEYADSGSVPRGEVDTDPDADTDTDRPVLAVSCADCPFSLHAPVTLGVVDHSAVVAFYDDHGIEVRDRPIWNLGTEWRESVLSTDPWCVRVSTRIDGDELDLLVGDGPTVVDVDRRHSGDDELTPNRSSQKTETNA